MVYHPAMHPTNAPDRPKRPWLAPVNQVRHLRAAGKAALVLLALAVIVPLAVGFAISDTARRLMDSLSKWEMILLVIGLNVLSIVAAFLVIASVKWIRRDMSDPRD